jgi:ferric iron reductase protein FhuF
MPDWVPCAGLVAGGTALEEALIAAAATLGGNDLVVGASVFAQSYAYRVAAVPLASWAVGLDVPRLRLDQAWVRLGRGRAAGIDYGASPVVAADRLSASDLVQDLVAGHLMPFCDALRRRVRLGHRLLRGNVAASCAVALRAVEGAAAARHDEQERALVRRRAEEFMVAAHPWLAGSGDLEVVESNGADGWFWNRTSCCLWFRASGGQACDDCSLIPAADLAARRRQAMAGEDPGPWLVGDHEPRRTP